MFITLRPILILCAVVAHHPKEIGIAIGYKYFDESKEVETRKSVT